ncbi:hypothetical protein LENED_008762 [Lentinula edodes]|uniref:SAP domain-containing protein n=1 Tax=Lentinula edodes TaxID=5353 RepID=A0A1Q3EI44_LENED|nr:hypothetical protein LENED_008762 [Lentinula edodes]
MSDSSHAQGTSTTNNDNLGISWEIGVIIGIIVIFLSVIAAAIFQRRRRRLASNMALDLEKTQHRRSSTNNISSTRPYSSSSTTLKETKELTNIAVEVPNFTSSTIPKPSPSASSAFLSSKGSPRAEYFPEHPRTLYFYTITLCIPFSTPAFSYHESIENAADVGSQLPPLLVTTNNDVDTNSRSLSFLLNSLGSQWTSFVLVAILVAPIYYFRGYFHVMDIDEPDTLSAATDPPPSSPPSSPGILSNVSSDIEVVDLGGEEFRIRRPSGPQPAHTIALPVYNHGVFEVEYVNIYIMKCASLVQLCKTNKLGVAGKKVELQEKLVAFSENMVRWKSLIAGARRSHRGIRDSKLTAASTKETTSILAPTKKPKKLKGSALRRITMMGLNSDGTSNSPAQRSKDMRTLAEQEALLRWADEYYAAHPYVPREDVLKELKAEGDAQVNSFACFNLGLISHSTFKPRIATTPTSIICRYAPSISISAPICIHICTYADTCTSAYIRSIGVCTCICTYACVDIHTYTYTYAYACSSAYICVGVCASVYIYTYACSSTYICIGIRASVYIHACTSAYICISVCVCTCPCIYAYTSCYVYLNPIASIYLFVQIIVQYKSDTPNK